MTRFRTTGGILLTIVAAVAAFVLPLSLPPNTVAFPPNNPQTAILTQSLDLHDGMVQKYGDTYYMYGTMYACGFQYLASSPFCGFGVSTASSLNGPWTTPTLLFPVNSISPFRNQTWQQLCGNTGRGCFNPRMIKRDFGPQADGTYILWFHAPADYSQLYANSYYSMVCTGPAGPCTAPAHKPTMGKCYANGDFSIYVDGATAYMVCTMANQTLSIEQLDASVMNGINVGNANIGGLTNVEAPGIYKDPATGIWILTYSDPNCGYCTGDGTGFAVSYSAGGGYYAPGNVGYTPDPRGRRLISATSCGGQPRTVFTVDGQTYEWIDIWGSWNGNSANQALAEILFVPMNFTPTWGTSGEPLKPQFMQWPCI